MNNIKRSTTANHDLSELGHYTNDKPNNLHKDQIKINYFVLKFIVRLHKLYKVDDVRNMCNFLYNLYKECYLYMVKYK